MDPVVLIGAQLLVNVMATAKLELSKESPKKQFVVTTPLPQSQVKVLLPLPTTRQELLCFSSDDEQSDFSSVGNKLKRDWLFDNEETNTTTTPDGGMEAVAPRTVTPSSSPLVDCIKTTKLASDLPNIPLLSSSMALPKETNSVQEALEKIRKKNRPPKRHFKSKFVGTETPHKIKAVLKRKFSWKNYPELEGLLIERREEYLQISEKYNYTTTQKEYNNALTEEVLDRASELGYIFERFSFTQIRDRIRCYYKSYIQALKKGKVL